MFKNMILPMCVLWAACAQAAELPEPAVISPPGFATQANFGSPPSDAVVIFDGKDTSGFVEATGWTVDQGVLTAGGKSVATKHQFAEAQIHVEFNLPVGDTKQRGNSGLYIHGLYEVQILDSFKANPYKPAQQCAAIYKSFPPLANACLPPGQWQSYDVIFHGAKLDGDGKLLAPARITVFQNGVLVQDNRPVAKGTGAAGKKKLVAQGPLHLQAHGSKVKFRNIWIRPIPAVGPMTAAPRQEMPAVPVKKIEPATPSTQAKAGRAPSDATVLFDGKDASGWLGKGEAPIGWKVENGYMEVMRKSGSIRSKHRFADAQLHVEWATPAEVQGRGQGRGNSGVYLHGRWEVQVLDSFQNKTYADGQAGAVYKQHAPLVNASRPPGQWQTYDIVFRRPRFDVEGKLALPGSFTVLHNGIVVQEHSINQKAPGKGSHDKPMTGPLLLQDHGNPVRYRNIWVRELK